MANAEKNKQKKTSLSGLVLKLAVAAAAVYLGVSFVSGQLQVASMRKELNNVTAETNRQKAENAELQKILDAGDENAYIERVAREKLGYAWPDERVFIDITGQ
ncbi:septum formation initiator family protein [Ruminococcaceae bacterium OttesenSCG-928-A16]|nr:septum formation initiator family protein [Ruminococcaceae bacterium OttesenSCG-928-A16]